MSSASGKKKKGLSLEEKIILVERWITAHPQPYTMKELQQLIPKQTPVIYQSVEECVLMLVAENRVEQDRVGVSTLFWKFPLTGTQKLKPAAHQHGSGGSGSGGGRLTYAELLRRLSCGDVPLTASSVEALCAAIPHAELREWHTKLVAEEAAVSCRLSAEGERVGCATADAEEGLLSELAGLQSCMTQRARLLAQQRDLASLQSLPETLRRLAGATAVGMESANRWTDNYYLAEMEVVSKTGQSQRDVRAALQVPPNVDFVSESEEEEESDHVQGEVQVVAGEGPAAEANGCFSSAPLAAASTEVLTATGEVLQPEEERKTCSPPSPSQERGSAVVVECAAADVSVPPEGETMVESAGELPPVAPATTKGRKPAPKKRSAQKRRR